MLLLVTITTACSERQPDLGWVEPARKIIDPESGKTYLREQVFVPSGPHSIASVFLRPELLSEAPVFVAVSGSQGGILTAESPLNRRMLANGFAVLVLGKKGVGASSGDWRDEKFEDRAQNVVAALDWLENRGDVDAGRTILYGHSQGGYVIPLLADEPRVAGMVLAAASVEPVRDQIWTDQYEAYLRQDMPEADARDEATSDQRWLDILLSGCGLWSYHYLCNIYEFEPEPYLSALDKPVLALFGENDPMVPPGRNMAPMNEYLEQNANARVVLLAKANHMFWRSETGSRKEYADLIGPPAQLSNMIESDTDHARLAELNANRVQYSEGYFEAVENFADQYARSGTEDAF